MREDTSVPKTNANGDGRQDHLAPSEQHLEDYLWAHPEDLDHLWLELDGGSVFRPLWRQFVLPSGKPDMIGIWMGLSLGIVELKRGPIDTRAFAQLMRYMRDIKMILDRTIMNYQSYRRPHHEYLHRDPIVEGNWDDILIRGVLVGSSVSDPHLLIACDACRVDVYTYQYADGQYTFSQRIADQRLWSDTHTAILRGAFDNLARTFDGLLGVRLEMDHEAAIRAHNNEFNAAKAAAEFVAQFKIPGGDS